MNERVYLFVLYSQTKKKVRRVEQTNKVSFEQYLRLALSHAEFSRNEATNSHPRRKGHTGWNIEGDASRSWDFYRGMGKALMMIERLHLPVT